MLGPYEGELAEAQSPLLLLWRARQLARSRDSEVRALVASNARCPESVRVTLARDRAGVVCAAVAGRADCLPATIAALANHRVARAVCVSTLTCRFVPASRCNILR